MMLKKLGSLSSDSNRKHFVGDRPGFDLSRPGFCHQASSTPLAGEGRTTVPSGTPIWAVQIDFTKPHDVAWTPADFITIAHSGINRVEINLDWNDLEPQKGQYDFHLLDADLAGAAQADQADPDFLGKPMGGTAGEKYGAVGDRARSFKRWQNSAATALVGPRLAASLLRLHGSHHRPCKTSPGFGGIFADYGWLDAMWGPDRGDMHGPVGYVPPTFRPSITGFLRL